VRIHKKRSGYSVAVNAHGKYSYVGTAATLHEAANAAYARLAKNVELLDSTPDNIAKATAHSTTYSERFLETINEYSFFAEV
jgi:L-alanine-DL-glutamate epimerase-like enolase superfamily enzyme